ncbi:MAG: SprT family zinc-dependent metalloprotease [Chloroflexi bacterium]|nr:SprT family zinc-dependent metalloprotease [Chloroflexota bacterium]
MTEAIELGDMVVDVIRKDIKNINLRVYPTTGRVQISAPSRMSLDTIRAFTISKLGWIKQVQKKLRHQATEAPLKYVDGETHYLWGNRYLLNVVEEEAPPRVDMKHSSLVLQVRPGTDRAKREPIIDRWYRDQLKDAVPALIQKWEAIMGVKVEILLFRKMKSRWGTCNPLARSIRLNSKLAKNPQECLEYVVVHEMVHLLEPTHNRRFRALMDKFMPLWRQHKDTLAGVASGLR